MAFDQQIKSKCCKTEFLLIGSHHKLNNLDIQTSVKIGYDCIKQVRHSRVLGVEIVEHLSWNKHIENVDH